MQNHGNVGDLSGAVSSDHVGPDAARSAHVSSRLVSTGWCRRSGTSLRRC